MVSLIKKGVGVIFDKVILRVKSLILGMIKGVWWLKREVLVVLSQICFLWEQFLKISVIFFINRVILFKIKIKVTFKIFVGVFKIKLIFPRPLANFLFSLSSTTLFKDHDFMITHTFHDIDPTFDHIFKTFCAPTFSKPTPLTLYQSSRSG